MNANLAMIQHVGAYLAMRRAFGYRLSVAGILLHNFARFADATAPDAPLTLDLALGWARTCRGGQRRSAAKRLVILRPFARYLRTLDPRTERIPKGILGAPQRRFVPHVYTEQELRDLLTAAGELRPRGGLRPRSMQTYLGLLACTGMRPPEPLKLTRDDVAFRAHTITIRETKFSKSRIVVAHATAVEALQTYARYRDRRVQQPRSPAFFLIDDGNPLTHGAASWAFRQLRRHLGWRARSGGRPPRLYDLRHTFVCRRLLEWYREGVDVDVAMPSLAAYLGHVQVTETYWYVNALPELMAVASARFERFAGSCDGGDR